MAISVSVGMRGNAPFMVGCATAGVLFSTLASAASFPCEKARSPIEKMICASEEVSVLDAYAGRYFFGAKMNFQHAERCLVSNQKTWLRQVRDRCGDAACLTRVYLDRLAVLHAAQPGMNVLRNVALPKLPPLVWIVPPASDEVAAPRNLPTKPLVARGQIVNDNASGDGYVLQTSAGQKYVVMPAMLIENPTAEALDALAKQPNAQYEMRGQTHARGQVATAFDAGQCVFVYRTSP